MKRISLHDIAKKARCSASTISRALKNDPQISSARKKQVRRIANALGYVPDPLLSRLAENRWGSTEFVPGSTIGYICNYDPAINGWVQAQLLAGVKKTADTLGYSIAVINLWGQKRSVVVERILKARGIVGVLVGPIHSAVPCLNEVNWDDFSIVTAGSSLFSIPSFHNVRSNPFSQLLFAGQMVFAHGYDNIGLVIIFHFDEFIDDRIRYGAYHTLKHEAETRGIQMPMLVLKHGAPHGEHTAKLVKWYNKYRPKAIIGFTDYIYWRLLMHTNLHCPQDFAFCSLHAKEDDSIAGVLAADEAEGSYAMQLLDILLRSRERGIPKNPIQHQINLKWRDGATMPKKNS